MASLLARGRDNFRAGREDKQETERGGKRESVREPCVFVVEIESKMRFSQVVAVSGIAASSADGAS